MLSLAAALAAFSLPPSGASYAGAILGVRVHAELVGHDPNGVQAVAMIKLRGATLGGSGRVEGFASISHTGDVFSSPPLRAALSKRFVRIDRLTDDLDHDDDGVPRRVSVFVDTPFLGRLRVPLARAA